MAVRSANKYLLEKLKESGATRIVPSGCTRFVSEHLDELPARWQNLSYEGLIKQIREMCELLTTTGYLIRKREKDIKGYVYYIK